MASKSRRTNHLPIQRLGTRLGLEGQNRIPALERRLSYSVHKRLGNNNSRHANDQLPIWRGRVRRTLAEIVTIDLSKSADQRESLIRLVMEGHLRGIIGQLTVEQIVKEPEMVAERMRATCMDDLSKMGLEVISFTIREVRDRNEYITNIGFEVIGAVWSPEKQKRFWESELNSSDERVSPDAGKYLTDRLFGKARQAVDSNHKGDTDNPFHFTLTRVGNKDN